jgi:hypothetical protein
VRGEAWRWRIAAVAIGCLLGVLSEAVRACQPAPFGAGSPAVSSDSIDQPHPDGTWAYWRCVDAFSVRTHVELRRHDHKLQLPNFDGMTLAQSFDALIVANRDTHYDAPALASLRAAAEAHAAAHPVAAPKWVVAKNGTTLTRPVYPLKADGTRGTTAVAGIRATVGAPCTCADPARRVGDGTASTYCDPRDVLPVVVTLCTKVAP